MAQPKHKEYWFKSRDQGWGWGLPINLKGWISYGVFVAIWFGSLAWFSASLDGDPIPLYRSALFVGIILADTAGLFYISAKHGEFTLPARKNKSAHTKSSPKKK